LLTEVNSVEMTGEIDCCLRMDLAVMVFAIDKDPLTRDPSLCLSFRPPTDEYSR